MKDILYTTHCPKCDQLSAMLMKANIKFREVTDVAEMYKLGIDKVDNGNLPVFEHYGKRMGFNEAIKWIKENGK